MMPASILCGLNDAASMALALGDPFSVVGAHEVVVACSDCSSTPRSVRATPDIVHLQRPDAEVAETIEIVLEPCLDALLREYLDGFSSGRTTEALSDWLPPACSLHRTALIRATEIAREGSATFTVRSGGLVARIRDLCCEHMPYARAPRRLTQEELNFVLAMARLRSRPAGRLPSAMLCLPFAGTEVVPPPSDVTLVYGQLADVVRDLNDRLPRLGLALASSSLLLAISRRGPVVFNPRHVPSESQAPAIELAQMAAFSLGLAIEATLQPEGALDVRA
jgi:hypothetical protein